jgi:NitT/TauT family transport system substrate-binding protein
MKLSHFQTAVVLLSLLFSLPAGAADRVRVHAPARTFFQLPLWLGMDKKIFESYGLHIEPIVMATPIAIAALSKGEIDFLTTGDSSGNAIIRGFKFKIILVYLSNNLFSLMVTPDIKRADDLKGKKIGVTSFGGNSFYSAQGALNSLGLEVGKDVSIIQVGGGTARMLAMESRAIHGAPLAPPDTEIVKERFNAWPIVGNESDIFLNEPSSVGLTTTETILQTKPDIVKRMLQASLQSVRYVVDERNEEELVRLIQNSWKLSRAASLGSLRSVRKLLHTNGILPNSGIDAVIRLQRARYQIQRDIKADELFDFALVRSLQSK